MFGWCNHFFTYGSDISICPHFCLGRVCCGLYNFFLHSDSVTVSGIILSGSSLKGTMSLEGPLPGMTDPKASTWEVYEKATQVRSNSNHPLPLTYRQVIDWEHLLIQDTLTDDEEEDMEEDEGDELDDDITMKEGDEEDPKKLEELQAKRHAKLQARIAAKKQRQMARLEERRVRLKEHQRKQEAVAEAEGDPMQYTTRVPVSGWYVACLEPYEDQVCFFRHDCCSRVAECPAVAGWIVVVMLTPSIVLIVLDRLWQNWKCAKHRNWVDWMKMETCLHMKSTFTSNLRER